MGCCRRLAVDDEYRSRQTNIDSKGLMGKRGKGYGSEDHFLRFVRSVRRE
jgi:hypothetical protein